MSTASTTVFLYVGLDNECRASKGKWPEAHGGHIELVSWLEGMAITLDALYEAEFAKLDPVSVDKNDRRFNVAPYQGVEFPRPTDMEIDAIELELQAFYHYLLSYQVDKHQASTPLKSDARNTLIELSQTTSESTADAVREGNMDFFIDQLPTSDAYKADNKQLPIVEAYRRALCDIMCRARPNMPCNVRRDELFALFNHTVGGMSASPATFTRFLGHRQLTIRPVAIAGGKTERGLSTTWTSAASFPAVLKEHFADMAKTKERA